MQAVPAFPSPESCEDCCNHHMEPQIKLACRHCMFLPFASCWFPLPVCGRSFLLPLSAVHCLAVAFCCFSLLLLGLLPFLFLSHLHVSGQRKAQILHLCALLFSPAPLLLFSCFLWLLIHSALPYDADLVPACMQIDGSQISMSRCYFRPRHARAHATCATICLYACLQAARHVCSHVKIQLWALVCMHAGVEPMSCLHAWG